MALARGGRLPVGQAGVFRGGEASGDAELCFVAFDLLLRDGAALAGLPLRERRRQLAEVVVASPGQLEVSGAKEVAGEADVMAALDAAEDRGEEGIMLKVRERGGERRETEREGGRERERERREGGRIRGREDQREEGSEGGREGETGASCSRPAPEHLSSESSM